MRKLCIILLAFFFFSACNNDDDGGVDTPPPPSVDAFTASISMSQNGEVLRLNINAIIHNCERARVYLEYQDHIDVPPGNSYRDLNKISEGVWERTTTWGIDDGLLEGGLLVRLEVYDGEKFVNSGFEEIVTITWPDPELESVRLSNVTQIEYIEGIYRGRVSFFENTLPNGQIKYLLYKDGNLLTSGTKTLIGENGSFEIGPIEMIENDLYQLLIENTDAQNPVYQFVDSSGNYHQGLSFEIIPQGEDPEVDLEVEMAAHSVVFLSSTETKISGEISRNFDTSETIVMKWYIGNNQAGETSFVTPEGNTNNVPFEEILSVLSNTQYTLKYFLNNEEVPFYTATFQTPETPGEGEFILQFLSVTNLTPSGFTVPFVATNTTNIPRTVEILFSSGGISQNVSVSVPANTTQYLGEASTDDWEQLTVVNFTAQSEGETHDSGSQQTSAITYSNIQNLNGNGGTSSQSITENQTLNFSDFKFVSNGTGSINKLSLVFTSEDNLHPWDYVMIIGIDGHNVVVNTSSAWENLGNGSYKVILNNLNIEVTTGNNTIPINLSATPTFPESETDAGFNYRTLATDTHNQSFGESATGLALTFQN